MHRPGPLQELPPGHFASAKEAAPQSSRKRPLPIHSPIYNPTKRRILNEEGFFAPKPLDLSFFYAGASQSSFSTPLKVPPSQRRSSADQLSSPGPPVSSSPVTPLSSRRRSPRSLPHSSSPDASPETPKKSKHPSSPTTLRRSPRLRSTSNSSTFTLVPRELPQLSDRQSAHYPGFDMHCDLHISIPTTSVAAIPQDDLGHNSMEGYADNEESKENLAPRKKTKKPGSLIDASRNRLSLSNMLNNRHVLQCDGGLQFGGLLAPPPSVPVVLLDALQHSGPCQSASRSKSPTLGVTPDERKERRKQMTQEDDYVGDDQKENQVVTL